MSNHTDKRGHRSRKEAQKTSLRLRDSDRAKAEAIAGKYTQGIEAALELVSILIDAAIQGDERAIAFLAKIGVEVRSAEVEPIIVRAKDGTISAWIV